MSASAAGVAKAKLKTGNGEAKEEEKATRTGDPMDVEVPEKEFLGRRRDWNKISDDDRKKFARGTQVILQRRLGEDDDELVKAGIPAEKLTLAALPRGTSPATSSEEKWIFIQPYDSIMAAHLLHVMKPELKIAILNFADDRKPSGRFYDGKSTQAESIALRTSLLASIDPKSGMDKNGKKMYPIGSEECQYTENARVNSVTPLKALKDDEPFYLDIITCPATRLGKQTLNLATGKMSYTDPKQRDIMAEKIVMILRAACAKGANGVVLGAFGCGIFNHPPEEVASIIDEVLTNNEKYEDWRTNGIDTVVVAIKDSTREMRTWRCFKDVFRDTKQAKIDWDGSLWIRTMHW